VFFWLVARFASAAVPGDPEQPVVTGRKAREARKSRRAVVRDLPHPNPLPAGRQVPLTKEGELADLPPLLTTAGG
jgi:hypothetical protein